MLSSIILSLAMSATPNLLTDTNSLNVEEVGRKRGGQINFTPLTIEEAGRKRGGQINYTKL